MNHTCKRCFKTFPHTREFFNWEVKKKGILKKACIDCFKIQAQGYRDKYKQEKLELAQHELVDMYTIEDINEEEVKENLYNAYVDIYKNAFEKTLTKEQFEQLNN